MSSSGIKHTCVVGVNHFSADISVRDRMGFSLEDLEGGLRSLLLQKEVSESLIISTCNRTEIYAVVDGDPAEIAEIIIQWWISEKRVGYNEAKPAMYVKVHQNAVEHLFRVACSLDSLVVGENQILNQIKGAYETAKKVNATKLYLNTLFQKAIYLGKRARSETEIGKGSVSISSAAVELLRRNVPDLGSVRVGVLGVGKMGVLAVKSLLDYGVSSLHFINRTKERTAALVEETGGSAWSLEELDNVLPDLDVLICGTASQDYIVTPSHFQERNSPCIIVDISSPRCVDPVVNEFGAVQLFDIDDLKSIVDENIERRRDAIVSVEQIIAEELDRFYSWYHSLEVVPVLSAFREKVQHIADTELAKCEGLFSEEQFESVKEVVRGITNKLLHEPTKALKKLGEQGKSKEVALYLAEMFKLDIE